MQQEILSLINSEIGKMRKLSGEVFKWVLWADCSHDVSVKLTGINKVMSQATLQSTAISRLISVARTTMYYSETYQHKVMPKATLHHDPIHSSSQIDISGKEYNILSL